MHYMHNYQQQLAFLAGLCVALAGGWYYISSNYTDDIPTDEYHIHADVVMVINDEQIDLSDTQYMSATGHILHADAHFHDGSDDIMHVHAEGIQLAEFYGSLGFSLTDTCITPPSGNTSCTNDDERLILFVNGIEAATVGSYVPQDSDQILIYYGSPDSPRITEYQARITNESCIYSGTCPERGLPPPESCGLTCEI